MKTLLLVNMFIFCTCIPVNGLINTKMDSSMIIHHNTDIKDSVVCETFGHTDIVYLHKEQHDTTGYKQLT
ncbi:MAG: hypothetical protein IKT87_01925, partial [Bacteroidaceae bacterium]|nr:hypothetical protein [Bacteroidaceae bacterium]